MEGPAVILVALLIKSVFGAICASIASGRGRSGAGWFVIGFLFDCIAIVIVLVLPDLKEEESRHRRLQTENRRLRERLLKDRHVSDQRHDVAAERLGVHDRALGLDTSSLQPSGDLATPPPTPEIGPSASVDAFMRAQWFYIVDGQQTGPVAYTELKRLWREGHIGGTTHLWSEGMADWQTLRELAELEDAFRA